MLYQMSISLLSNFEQIAREETKDRGKNALLCTNNIIMTTLFEHAKKCSNYKITTRPKRAGRANSSILLSQFVLQTA